MTSSVFTNPFRPGAGHMPPYLAGREHEEHEFRRLLTQDLIIENMVLTGLRGVGKTVLLDTLKPMGIQADWLWAGTDLSEATSITEERMALRLITDLSVITSGIVIHSKEVREIGFGGKASLSELKLDFHVLWNLYQTTPGLTSDKLKHVLEVVWDALKHQNKRGVVFAYDEAQNLADHASDKEYPLSLLLDVFQSLQKRGVPFMLTLVGLPTLFPKLVEARTFADRMFHIVFLDRLTDADSREAILRPIRESQCPLNLSEKSVQEIVDLSGGYPYFIQFVCRDVYDAFLQQIERDQEPGIPVEEITRKLDSDFFAGRWARATDRQRQLLQVIARVQGASDEFSVQDVAEKARELLKKPFSPSHISQMLAALCSSGLLYKNRHGRYSFAVPLLDRFILRQPMENV